MTAIIPAAGLGRRLAAGKPKAFFRIRGKPLLVYTLANLAKAYPFREMIVAAHPAHVGKMRRLLTASGFGRARVVSGGTTRAASVLKALHAVDRESRWVLIHDAARPLVALSCVKNVLSAAYKTGAALCALPVTSTVKRSDGRASHAVGTEDRHRLFLAQTPQVFRKDLLLQRYGKLGNKALRATDEAALFDGTAVKVRLVIGEAKNIKITTREDVELFEIYLKQRPSLRGA